MAQTKRGKQVMGQIQGSACAYGASHSIGNMKSIRLICRIARLIQLCLILACMSKLEIGVEDHAAESEDLIVEGRQAAVEGGRERVRYDRELLVHDSISQ